MDRYRRWSGRTIRERLKQALTTAGVVLAVAVIVAGMGWWVWLSVGNPLWAARDIEGATIQHGMGTVTSITYRQATRENPTPPMLVWLRLNGQDVMANTYAAVRAGDSVKVDYRVGKSGRIYVESIEAQNPPK